MCLTCLNCISYIMLRGDQSDPNSSLINRLHSVAISSVHRIVIGGLITSIARFVRREPNPGDRVFGSKQMNLATFEQMIFLYGRG